MLDLTNSIKSAANGFIRSLPTQESDQVAAIKALTTGRPNDALEHLDRLQNSPRIWSDPAVAAFVAFHRAEAFYRKGHSGKALELYNEIKRKTDPSYAPYLAWAEIAKHGINLAESCDVGDKQAAVSFFSDAKQNEKPHAAAALYVDGEEGWIVNLWAQSRYQVGNAVVQINAKKTLYEMQEQNLRDTRPLLSLANCALAEGKSDLQADLFQEAYRRSAQDPLTICAKIALLAAERDAGWKQQCDELKNSLHSLGVNNGRILCSAAEIACEAPMRALQLFQDAKVELPNDRSLDNRLFFAQLQANTFHPQSNDVEEIYSNLVNLEPQWPNTAERRTHRPGQLRDLIFVAQHFREFKQALVYSKELCVLRPGAQALAQQAGLLLQQMEDEAIDTDAMRQRAKRLCEDALRFDPNCYDALMILTEFSREVGDFASMKKWLAPCREHHPHEPEPLHFLALAAFFEKDWLRAEDLFSQYLDGAFTAPQANLTTARVFYIEVLLHRYAFDLAEKQFKKLDGPGHAKDADIVGDLYRKIKDSRNLYESGVRQHAEIQDIRNLIDDKEYTVALSTIDYLEHNGSQNVLFLIQRARAYLALQYYPQAIAVAKAAQKRLLESGREGDETARRIMDEASKETASLWDILPMAASFAGNFFTSGHRDVLPMPPVSRTPRFWAEKSENLREMQNELIKENTRALFPNLTAQTLPEAREQATTFNVNTGMRTAMGAPSAKILMPIKVMYVQRPEYSKILADDLGLSSWWQAPLLSRVQGVHYSAIRDIVIVCEETTRNWSESFYANQLAQELTKGFTLGQFTSHRSDLAAAGAPPIAAQKVNELYSADYAEAWGVRQQAYFSTAYATFIASRGSYKTHDRLPWQQRLWLPLVWLTMHNYFKRAYNATMLLPKIETLATRSNGILGRMFQNRSLVSLLFNNHGVIPIDGATVKTSRQYREDSESIRAINPMGDAIITLLPPPLSVAMA